MLVGDLKKVIREIPDFPKPGITFYDLSTLFRNATAFRIATDKMIERYRGEKIDAIVGIEARGFVVASAMARELEAGLVLVRKPAKLPAEVETEEYSLEYGTGRIEVHRDAITAGQRVLVVDDLLATGGTAAAAGRLVERLGGVMEGFAFMVELGFLNGRRLLGAAPVFSLIHYG
jgi:adenine phosphoribosyltransferase